MGARRPIVVGHRANSGRILLWYARMGVRYVEVDVSLGPRGEPVVRHGPPETRRATPVGRLFAWIDYKLFYRDPLLRTQPLAEWLRRISERLRLEGVLIDLKASVPPGLVRDALRESGFRGLVMVSANDHRLLPGVARELPGAWRLASFSVRPLSIARCLEGTGATGFGMRIDLLDEDAMREARRLGLRVSTWTVNTREQAVKAARLGVDVVISDRPDIVEKALGGLRPVLGEGG